MFVGTARPPVLGFTDNHRKRHYSVMPVRDAVLSTHEVSLILGVEARQVRALAERGFITRIARGVFDRESVEHYRRRRGSGRTRTWTEPTAWAAVSMLSGVAPQQIGDTQTYRLRAALRTITEPSELAIRLRDRATVTTWSGHRSVLERVRKELVVPDRARLGLVEDTTRVDGYLAAGGADDLVARHRLRDDPQGVVTLRSTSTDVTFLARLITVSRTLAAVDAATSLDPRERGVGEGVLARRLELFRENVRA